MVSGMSQHDAASDREVAATLRTRRLSQRLDTAAIGAASGLLFTHQGHTLAGVGEWARIGFERPDGWGHAQAALRALAADADSNPAAFAALPFDPTQPGELIVPQICVGEDPDGARWITGPKECSDAELITAATAVIDRHDTRQPTRFDLRSSLPPEQWRDVVMPAALEQIATGRVRKVVMARELVLETDQPVPLAEVIGRLRQSFGSAMVFSIDGFIGASPEMLVSRAGDIVRAHPLAGTMPRASDPAEDARMAASLLSSEKNQIEHGITIDWLLDSLLPFCSYVDAEPEPSIVTLANVHHLGTRVEGRLSAPSASVLELVAALHPTPAVGGDPQGEALAVISEVEGFDRGRYAGPTGWVDSQGNGVFAVSVRSATVNSTTVRICAGVGVVADSDPEAELAETRAKFQAMLSALIRP